MTEKTKKTEKEVSKFDYKSIKTFEDACIKESIDPLLLPDVSMLPEDLRKPIVSAYKLMIIYKAINNGWVPDWGNYSEYKYFPWYSVVSSGFGFSLTHYHCTGTYAHVGSRLCTDTSQKALYVAKQFEELYKDYLLIP